MDEILGQSRVIEVLQAALQSGRVHHAFIFHGQEGIGKLTTAKAFARILLCHDQQRDLSGRIIACGACESCRLLSGEGDDSTKAHPDLHIIRKELAIYDSDKKVRDRKLMNIPIDVIRKWFLGPVYLASKLKHQKVFIIDEADMMDRHSQNAILKTLEEPPTGTYLILISESNEWLLPTIRSRCQHISFLPLPDEVIRKWIDKHARELPEASKVWLLEFAGGSLGRVELALRNNLAAWAQAILPALDEASKGKFAANLGSLMAEKIDDFAKRWVDEHENASKEAANKFAASLMWVLISQHARRRLATLATKLDPDDPDACMDLLSPWIGVIDSLNAAEMEIGTNVNLGIAADHLASRIYRALSGEAVLLDA
ncbi:MAG: DNA polymerase III subunit [Phycisphaeraceae bacterium]|nr:DNA polymerase III subunit [Phycisphaeraceae bacterium]